MELITGDHNDQFTNLGQLAQAGQAANHAAAQNLFADYKGRKAVNTLRRQASDLAILAEFLQMAGLPVGDLVSDPEAWRGMTWGLVAAFVKWQLGRGYAVSSVNFRLSTVKIYAGLAAQAGMIPGGEYALIRQVKSYKRTEQIRLDEKRAELGTPTRTGAKKAVPVLLTKAQAARLRQQPDTPQGRRDSLLVALMLNLGLRCGEVAALTVDCFDLKAGVLTFYRPKVGKAQTHRLTNGTLAAARAYFESGEVPAQGNVWRSSRKGRGGLQGQGMTTRAIAKRIRELGETTGLTSLSPHDLRHYWATWAARNGTPMDRLQDAGGWSSLAMPARYIEAAKIANEGVRAEE